MQNQTILLSSKLSISAKSFAAEWNQLDECRQVAQATVEDSRSDSSPLEALDVSVGVLLLNVATGIAASAIYDLIKKVFEEKGIKAPMEIKPKKLKDGAEAIIVS